MSGSGSSQRSTPQPGVPVGIAILSLSGKLPLAPCTVALPLDMSFGPQSPVFSPAIRIGIGLNGIGPLKTPLTP